ncbi:acetyl xylan esterase [Serratia marcescens subsp. marcescens ATCC 13880]|nr:acetyl xylan esterase [Serratia marcescens]PNU42982.1 acetyl xylan esterase [Serratia marcescens subsp. marcescens ATCC 13880]RTF01212.1 acetyl xylan esterase [Serratia marcescens subsp. marcescens ATCC 13880]TXE54379.1 acetyl xylan esterase [Serratia nematodiphila]
MQVHERPQAAPLLARQGINNACSCMQNHAPYACTRFLTLASQEKGCFWGRIGRA